MVIKDAPFKTEQKDASGPTSHCRMKGDTTNEDLVLAGIQFHEDVSIFLYAISNLYTSIIVHEIQSDKELANHG